MIVTLSFHFYGYIIFKGYSCFSFRPRNYIEWESLKAPCVCEMPQPTEDSPLPCISLFSSKTRTCCSSWPSDWPLTFQGRTPAPVPRGQHWDPTCSLTGNQNMKQKQCCNKFKTLNYGPHQRTRDSTQNPHASRKPSWSAPLLRVLVPRAPASTPVSHISLLFYFLQFIIIIPSLVHLWKLKNGAWMKGWTKARLWQIPNL